MVRIIVKKPKEIVKKCKKSAVSQHSHHAPDSLCREVMALGRCSTRLSGALVQISSIVTVVNLFLLVFLITVGARGH